MGGKPLKIYPFGLILPQFEKSSPYYRLINFSLLTNFESGKRRNMGFLIVSILVAIATATSVYIATASVMLAFIAYATAGTFTLLSAVIADGLADLRLKD